MGFYDESYIIYEHHKKHTYTFVVTFIVQFSLSLPTPIVSAVVAFLLLLQFNFKTLWSQSRERFPSVPFGSQKKKEIKIIISS